MALTAEPLASAGCGPLRGGEAWPHLFPAEDPWSPSVGGGEIGQAKTYLAPPWRGQIRDREVGPQW